MQYEEYKYLWPPRPESPVPEGLIPFYANRGYWAQVKKNGTCTLVFTNGRQVIFKTRHGDVNDGEHNQWSPTPEIIKFFQGGTYKWNVYVAELLHNKTKNIKNQLYIFDKIVDEGIHLVGTTFEDRQLILQSQYDGSFEPEPHFNRVSENVSIAANFTGAREISKVYRDIVKDENGKDRVDNPQDEGVVLKNPKGKLVQCFKATANNGWMVKVRRPHKNYSF